MNPQEKIVSASVSYQVSDWVFRQVLESTPQMFPLKTTVTFLAVDQNADLFVPIAPALVPDLPWDLWYPFVASGEWRWSAGGESEALVRG